MSAIKLDGLTLASTANSKAVLDSGVVFPAGHIIDFKTTTNGNEITGITEDSWVTTELSIQITPKYINSKIVVISTFGFTAGNPEHTGFKVVRTGPSTQDLGIQSNFSNLSSSFVPQMCSYSGIDSPNTDSSLCTYTLYFYVVANSGSAYWNYDGKYSSVATMFLMEIKE